MVLFSSCNILTVYQPCMWLMPILSTNMKDTKDVPTEWCLVVQVELVVDEMRRSLARRAGVDRRLPQFVGLSGFQDFAINIVVLVSSFCVPFICLTPYFPTACKEVGLSLCSRAVIMWQGHILLMSFGIRT